MYELEAINSRARRDPELFVRECDEEYDSVVALAVQDIEKNVKNSSVVLMSGPSGSTKTTTAKKICDGLRDLGHQTYVLSLDDYFLDVSPEQTPRLPDGNYDFESPKCLDMELIELHFQKISNHEQILVPRFDFLTQKRSPQIKEIIRPTKDTFVIFEGLHALNDDIAGAHPEAYKLYVCADPRISYEGKTIIEKGDLRFIRRSIRDSMFRGRGVSYTYEKRSTVSRGEQLYILPYTHRANRCLDTFQQCEMGIYRDLFLKLLSEANMDTSCSRLRAACAAAQGIEQSLLPEDSVIREFIGGGSYQY